MAKMTKSGKMVWSVALLCASLLGCGDSTSDTTISSTPLNEDYCEVISKEPLVVKAVERGIFRTTTFKYENEKVVEKAEFKSAEKMESACLVYRENSNYSSVVCNDKSIVAVRKDIKTSDGYDDFVLAFSTMCDDLTEPEDDDISSSSREKDNPFIFDRSSSSQKVSSSSRQSDLFGSSSSSKTQYAESSSSSTVSDDGKISWYGGAWYKKEKVVAANVDELDCTDNTNLSKLNDFDVAYEFNKPGDLGRDYLGNVNAYIEGNMTPVSAECGSLVLDGTNGLLVPLNDVFKTRGFVIEIRFMPTQEADLGNIFVAEPPGSGLDAWQVRMDGTTVNFHVRDSDHDYSAWEVHEVGDVALNEWHVVRIKVFPTKSANGDVFYSLNASLDGSLRLASEFKRDLSGLMYGLGIGYDAVHQAAYARKFFTGKIDYIRYGRILEDDL